LRTIGIVLLSGLASLATPQPPINIKATLTSGTPGLGPLPSRWPRPSRSSFVACQLLGTLNYRSDLVLPLFIGVTSWLDRATGGPLSPAPQPLSARRRLYPAPSYAVAQVLPPDGGPSGLSLDPATVLAKRRSAARGPAGDDRGLAVRLFRTEGRYAERPGPCRGHGRHQWGAAFGSARTGASGNARPQFLRTSKLLDNPVTPSGHSESPGPTSICWLRKRR
jgi:hypothetical protein